MQLAHSREITLGDNTLAVASARSLPRQSLRRPAIPPVSHGVVPPCPSLISLLRYLTYSHLLSLHLAAGPTTPPAPRHTRAPTLPWRMARIPSVHEVRGCRDSSRTIGIGLMITHTHGPRVLAHLPTHLPTDLPTDLPTRRPGHPGLDLRARARTTRGFTPSVVPDYSRVPTLDSLIQCGWWSGSHDPCPHLHPNWLSDTLLTAWHCLNVYGLVP